MAIKDRKKGLLRLFILRTLSEAPKSGYDILKEVEATTKGEWTPSKGTVYPLLDELEEEGLIESVEEGARARRAFRTTSRGMEHLRRALDAHRSSVRRTIDGRRRLFLETFFDGEEREILRLSHAIRQKALQMKDRSRVLQVLKDTLQRLEEDGG